MTSSPTRTVVALALAVGLASSAEAGSGRRLTIEWDGGTIRFEHNQMLLEHGATFVPERKGPQPSKSPVVDCYFAEMKTKCWKLKHARRSKSFVEADYGDDLLFVKPIAVLPLLY